MNWIGGFLIVIGVLVLADMTYHYFVYRERKKLLKEIQKNKVQ